MRIVARYESLYLGCRHHSVNGNYFRSIEIRQEGSTRGLHFSLSSFAVDPKVTKPPDVPDDLEGVSIEYFASGCLGTCPSFTLHIEKDKAVWEGHAFVKKKGIAERHIPSHEFREIIQAWLDAKMYAMRDDYCEPICPDGTTTIITDVQDTSIVLKTPSYSKKVLECFTTTNGKPDNPRPPAEYSELSRRLLQFAKANRWL
jgi:hypothetical protein